MGDTTKIEWADATVNWWWGCTKISPGCANCYAETLAARFGVEWGPNVPRKVIKGAPAALERLARQGDKTGIAPRVFMQSMSDLFEDREDLIEPRKVLWDLLHKFATEQRRIIPMLLTKRPALMAAWAKENGWPDTVWAGASVENQKAADERIPHLLTIPARVRFLSCEPLLGAVDLRAKTDDEWEGEFDNWHRRLWGCRKCGGSRYLQTEPYVVACDGCAGSGVGISWVICGGESGAKARPMHPQWARSLRDQCQNAGGVAFFLKQAAWYGKMESTPTLDGVRWTEVPDGVQRQG